MNYKLPKIIKSVSTHTRNQDYRNKHLNVGRGLYHTALTNSSDHDQFYITLANLVSRCEFESTVSMRNK